MENRIDATFSALRAASRKALIAYIGAGDPDLRATIALVRALAAAGVDCIELGIPFSDPLADGIVNQMAAQRGLASGTTVAAIFDAVREIRSDVQIPIVLYTYLNPVLIYGAEKFDADATAAGIDGVLALDLPPEEDSWLNKELAAIRSLRQIRLIAPTTPKERIASIVESAEGFIYYVSREGVTGERAEVADTAEARVQEIKQLTDLPVVVGFGISTPAQAAAVAKFADAVVVGSAIVKQIAEQGAAPDLAERIGAFVKPLADAVHAVK